MIAKSQKSNYSQSQNSSAVIRIGYYNLRGKAQVCRLLCEYLGVQYEDKYFSLHEWSVYKAEKTKKWVFSDLPYLQEGEFVVTDPVPMCLYIVARFGNPDFLGKTIEDKAIVDMYLWTIEIMSSTIGINCQKGTPEELKAFKQKQWRESVSTRLQKYQNFAHQTDWFLGYLTIIDFSIYELVRYMDMIFPGKIKQFSRLQRIKQMIAQLPQIKSYEQSASCVREMDPTSLLAELNKKKAADEAALKAQEYAKINCSDEIKTYQIKNQQTNKQSNNNSTKQMSDSNKEVSDKNKD